MNMKMQFQAMTDIRLQAGKTYKMTVSIRTTSTPPRSTTSPQDSTSSVAGKSQSNRT